MPLDMTPYFHPPLFCLVNGHVIVRAGAELNLFNLGHFWGTVLQAWKVAASIPADVIVFFSIHPIVPAAFLPWG
jgi:hypothetical protein